MARSAHLKNVHRLVVKVGTRVLTDARGHPDPTVFRSIAEQAAALMEAGKDVVLVSSGAIASGRSLLQASPGSETIPDKQAMAAIGQPRLVSLYQEALAPYGRRAAQVLLTRDDLAHRRRYLNARNTLLRLLQLGVLPVVNENDTVVVQEIKFGDNDNLSAQVSVLVDADLLLLLTDAPGLCDRGEGDVLDTSAIPFVDRVTPRIRCLARGPEDPLSTGGMATKVEAALHATQAGHPAVIADGRAPGAILDILAGREIGTFFAPLRDRMKHRKHWIAHMLPSRGRLVLDPGALNAIAHHGKSLLPSGIVRASGRFDNGDMVLCVDEAGNEWARGLTNYSSGEVTRIAGRQSSEIEEVLGYRFRDEIIHRDQLVVTRHDPNRPVRGAEP